MFGWFSKKSPALEGQIVEPDVVPAQAPPVMREIPARPAAPAGATAPPPRNGTPAPEAPPAPDHLVEWLMHAQPDTRIAAARELGRRDDRRAVEPLIGALSDVHAPVRIAVANALGKLRDERAIDALATALAEDEDSVRAAARSALEAIGTTLANAVLAEDDRRRRPPAPAAAPATSVATEQTPAARDVAPTAKPQPQPDNGLAWLLKGLQSDDAAVHGPAMTALAEAGPAAVEPLIALLRDDHIWTRRRAAEILGRIGDARAAEPLTKAIDAITPEDRSYESYALRETLRAALAAVNPPAPVEEPVMDKAQAPVEAQAPVDAPVEVPIAADLPLAVSQPQALQFTVNEVASPSAKPQAEDASPRQPEPVTFIAGVTDATDEQLGERLREIAQAALGGGRPPLDSFDARREAARAIGLELHRRGGHAAMERALDEYASGSLGRHSISQAWDGVGEWRG